MERIQQPKMNFSLCSKDLFMAWGFLAVFLGFWKGFSCYFHFFTFCGVFVRNFFVLERRGRHHNYNCLIYCSLPCLRALFGSGPQIVRQIFVVAGVESRCPPLQVLSQNTLGLKEYKF
jgi:hypothetical protein